MISFVLKFRLLEMLRGKGLEFLSHAPFLWPHALGLDAAFIAILWQENAAHTLHLHLGDAERIVLFCGVWGIYLCDRLWDVWRLPETELPSLQHYWTRQKPRIFLLLGMSNFVTAGIFALQLDHRIWRAGSILGLLCVVYYMLHGMTKTKGGTLWRALLLGFIFAAGSLAIPFVESSGGWRNALILYFSLSLVFSTNAIACMQAEERIITRKFIETNPLIMPALLVSTTCSLIAGNTAPLLAAVALSVVLHQRARLSPDAFAALCDASLLIPAVLLL